jgi:hypothetical protein
MGRFENINKNLFAALCSVLNAKGANIEMDVSFVDGKIITLDIPYVGTGTYNGNEGFYFRANRDFFGVGLEQLRDSFPYNIDGYKFEYAGFSEFEMDDDRTWSESIGFIVSKDGKNVLE